MFTIENFLVSLAVFLILFVVFALAGLPYAGLIALAFAILFFVFNGGGRVASGWRR
jgi:predicted PurR-regulated permease PerM